MNKHWLDRFMKLANETASWSKDPSSKVGCVLVDPVDRTVVGMGFNGYPRGVNDSIDVDERDIKYMKVIHAEANAILQADRGKLRGAYAFVTHPPCSNCTGLLIQAGIAHVFCTAGSPEMMMRFKDSFEQSCLMASQSGVILEYV